MTEPFNVIQLVTTMSSGGAQRTVIETSTDLVPGVEVTVLCGPDSMGEGDLWDEARARGVQIHVVPRLHRSIRPLDDVLALLWLLRELRGRRPDVLHTHSTKAGVLGRLAGALARVPVVHTVHGWSFAPFDRGPVRAAVILLERGLARLSRRLVAVTTADIEVGLAEGIGKPELYAVVRSGIQLGLTEDGARGAARAVLGLGDDDVVVGTVARLSAQKNLDMLLRAFARSGLAEMGAKLVLIGDGPERITLQAQADELGVAPSVHFVGSRDDARHLVSAFDVFALSSRWEGLPRTILEAMDAGVPVAATPVGGVGEVVEHEVTGLIVPVDSDQALAEALQRLLDDTVLVDGLIANARRLVLEFSQETMRRDVVDVWKSAAVDGRTHPAHRRAGRRSQFGW